MIPSSLSLKPGDYRLQETTPPAEEPVTLAEIKAHLRLSGSAEDADIAARLTAARVSCENFANKCFVSRSVSLFLDRWPRGSAEEWWDGVREGAAAGEAGPLKLPIGPLQAVPGIYTYTQGGESETLSAATYQVDLLGGRLHFLAPPPEPARAMNGIEIRMTAGFGAASSVPVIFKQAIKQVTAHLYTHRGDAPEQALIRCGATALLAPFREVAL